MHTMAQIEPSEKPYPEHSKLLEKYSPTKRIPPVKSPELLSEKFKHFATGPQRNVITNKPINSASMSYQSLPLPPPSMNLNPGTSLKSEVQSTRNSKGLHSSGELSPIRRSGSPIRRQHINQIEQEMIKKRTADDELESLPKKYKNVTFNKSVQYDDGHAANGLNDEMNDFNKRIKKKGLEDARKDHINTEQSQLISKFDAYIKLINARLDNIEAIQNHIMSKLNILVQPDLNIKIDALQESIDDLKKFIKD